MKATAKDLRFNTSALLQTVARGEEVVISFRGKPVAKLVPMATKQAAKAEPKLKGFGMWKDRPEMKDSVAYIRALRKPRF
jgi:prevent-host-death family protein